MALRDDDEHAVARQPRPGEPLVLAGDFNLRPGSSTTLEALASPEWGFSNPAPRIDQILVRGAEECPE